MFVRRVEISLVHIFSLIALVAGCSADDDRLRDELGLSPAGHQDGGMAELEGFNADAATVMAALADAGDTGEMTACLDDDEFGRGCAPPDAGPPDAGPPDAGPADAGEPPVVDAGSDASVTVGEGSPGCPNTAPDGFRAGGNPACMNQLATGTFTPVVEWYMPTFGTGTSDQIMTQPIVTNLTDDDGNGLIDAADIPDIVVVAYGGAGGAAVHAISGDGSTVHWTVAGMNIQPQGGVAAGDIDGDTLVEVIAATRDGLIALEHDGSVKWTMTGLSGHIYGTSDTPSISDMNHDGSPEIIMGRAIVDAQGNLIAAGSYGRGGVSTNVGTASFAVDLDNDGMEEVVTGNAAYRMDGSALWYNGLTDGYPAVLDAERDGIPEIVVSNAGLLRMMNAGGTELWSASIPGADQSYYGGPPTVADYDGDGAPEIGVASGSRYSVFEADGTLLWQAVTDDSSSGNTGSAVFDFEGDGAAEVVYADETRLWVFNGPDGTVKLESTEHSNGTWLEYPTIADVDGDGHAEIVVVNTASGSPSYTGLHVFGDLNDSWRPGRRIWNQHPYFITNVNDDGSIPLQAPPNWLTYNNFRSGDSSLGDGLLAPDLTLADGGLCEASCEAGTLRVWIHVGNIGASPMPPSETITVTLTAVIGGNDVPLDSFTLRQSISPGQFLAAFNVDIDGRDPSTFEGVRAEVSSTALECDTTNNTITWVGPFCE